MELNSVNNIPKFILHSKNLELVLSVAQKNLLGMPLEYGPVKNVVSKLQEQHMISAFNAKILVDSKENTTAIFDSINTDNEYYPENPTKTKMSLNEKIEISIESEHISHLRANLNSTLRLIQASYDSIESVKI